MRYKKTLIPLSFLFMISATPESKPKPVDLDHAGLEEILSRYSIIADFSQKEPERAVSSQLFWKYPFKAPSPNIFPDMSLGKTVEELPVTPGEGRAIEHMNHGRAYFFKGDYEEARNSWLAGRARFGNEYPFHRRNDYFIGVAFLQLANKTLLENHNDWTVGEVRRAFANAATFLSWALIKKKDLKDAELDVVTPKALLALSSIYLSFDRFSGAYATAEEGLNFLNESGRKDYRFAFHKILSESMIRNRSYLKAVQELDSAIRQDPNPKDVGDALGRIGDIYFDLNNYELAEDMYGLSMALSTITKRKDPERAFLRGESLFWMGKFSDAQKALWFAIEELAVIPNSSSLAKPYASWGSLRIADAYLARMQIAQENKQTEEVKKLANESKLAYDRVIHQYRDTEASKIAQVRLNCLELPEFEGKNINHTRVALSESKNSALPAPAKEIAWACEVSSYTQRETTSAMVDRVRDFAKTYPDSQFSKTFVEPVRTMQASYLDDYLKEKDQHKAIAYYETNRNTVFTKLTASESTGLFRAYVDTLQSPKAKGLYSAFKAANIDDELRRLVFVSEIYGNEKTFAWKKLGVSLAKEFTSKKISLNADEKTLGYVYRILSSPLGFENLEWIHRSATEWSAKDPRIDCQILYLTLSKSLESPQPKSMAKFQEIQTIVDARVPKLLKIDRSCALNYLDLEQKAGETFTKEYAEKWLTRTHWSLEKPVPELFWLASESLANIKEQESATKIWKFLNEKLPPEAPEAKLSALRLNPTIPETQKFWAH